MFLMVQQRKIQKHCSHYSLCNICHLNVTYFFLILVTFYNVLDLSPVTHFLCPDIGAIIFSTILSFVPFFTFINFALLEFVLLNDTRNRIFLFYSTDT